MTTPHTRGSGADDTLETAIQARLDSLESGNYRANNELVLEQFRQFLERDRDVARLPEPTVLDCRRYAQWLRTRAKDDEDPLAATSLTPTVHISRSSERFSDGVSTTNESKRIQLAPIE
ncbi:hypothetical protein ACFQH8_19740 [Halomicroarcula sp. GCM10025710]